MRPEWSSVERVLLVCCDAAVLSELNLLLKDLQTTLPQAETVLLRLQAHRYEFLKRLPDGSAACLQQVDAWDLPALITAIADGQFDAAILFTGACGSPYALAYCCYLAGIPIRVGQSREFGGAVLSHCITPPIDPVPLKAHLQHLLAAVGLCETASQKRLDLERSRSTEASIVTTNSFSSAWAPASF